MGLILGGFTAAAPTQALDCGRQPDLCRALKPTVAAVTAEDLQEAITLRPTCYDPGAACAGGCDPHAVIDPRDNGQIRIHAPGSVPGQWQPCVIGGPCHVCLTNAPDECIRVTFRGGGPDPGRILFSAPFWEIVCGYARDLPTPYAAECERIQQRATILRNRTACLREPQTPGCDAILPAPAAVARARAALTTCLRAREGKGDMWECYYPDGLSVAACEDGAVNAAGSDCCSGEPGHDACVEGCERYYLRRGR